MKTHKLLNTLMLRRSSWAIPSLIILLCLLTYSSAFAQSSQLQLSQAWTVTYDNFKGGADVPNVMALDAGGNVFVAGTSASQAGQQWVLVKYDSNGQLKWQSREATVGGAPLAITIVGNSIYVAGRMPGAKSKTSQNMDYFVVKYIDNGNSLTKSWTGRYVGNATENDAAFAIAVSGANVYLTGRSTKAKGTAGQYELATVKFVDPLMVTSSVQTPIRVSLYDGDGIAEGMAIAVVGSNIYVSGKVYANNTYSYVTIKYEDSGSGPGFVYKWENKLNGGGSTSLTGHEKMEMVVDGSSIYVAGRRTIGSNYDYLTYRITDGGSTPNLAWQLTYGGASGDDEATGLIVKNGGVYVTGKSYRAGKGFDFATVKYGTDGTYRWDRVDGENGNDGAADIAVDDGDNVFVTGSFTKNGTLDYRTYWYKQTGGDITDMTFATFGSTKGDEIPVAIAVNNGSIYVTGSAPGNPKSTDFLTVKYTASVSSTSGVSNLQVAEVAGSYFTAYPTAFSESTTLAFVLEKDGAYTLDMYDMKGSLVRRVHQGVAKAGIRHTHELSGNGLAEGLYITRLSTSSTAHTLKVVVQR